MESALGSVGTPAEKSYPFQAPPAAAQSLANAGFDLVSLANNHAMDYGAEALLQAIDLLKEQGVTPIGAGANEEAAHTPAIVQINGITLAFLAYVNVPVEGESGFDTATWTATAVSPGLAWADPDRIRQDVAAIAPTVDHTIVVLHSGYEYIAEPSPPQIAAAHAAIEAGASLVIGHHAHILQGIEFYQNGVILYGTGNFAFQIAGSPETAVFHIWLDKKQIREIGIQPAIIQADGQPRPALPEETAQIRQQLYQLTAILNPQ
jgi:poly-gamma-glutamate synthesis protein (capsule biosynthesis protein)